MARWSGLPRCWHVDTMPRRASRIIRTPKTPLLYLRTGTLPQWTALHRSGYHRRLVRATTVWVRVEDHNDSPEHTSSCMTSAWVRCAGGTALRCPNLDGMENTGLQVGDGAHQTTTPLWETAAANNRTIEVQTD